MSRVRSQALVVHHAPQSSSLQLCHLSLWLSASRHGSQHLCVIPESLLCCHIHHGHGCTSLVPELCSVEHGNAAGHLVLWMQHKYLPYLGTSWSLVCMPLRCCCSAMSSSLTLHAPFRTSSLARSVPSWHFCCTLRQFTVRELSAKQISLCC